jgi:carboxymethylenebutenolidase
MRVMPMIELQANGKSSAGWLAQPAGKGNGRGIVVLQEWWGLVPHIKDVADRFAAEGYVALAPDLWDGQTAKNPDEAGRLFMALNIDVAARQIKGAIGALRAAGAQGPVGVVGYCMGGQLALYTACAYPDDVGAVVDFYGIHPKVTPDLARLKAPVLGIFGESDQSVSPAVARKLEADVKQAGGRMETVIYPAGHAFFNDTRPEVYARDHAADAWKRTLAFFAANL